MIRVERGAEISPGVFAYTVPSLGLSGRSRQPPLDACRQIKSLLGPTGQLAGLFRKGHSEWDIRCPVDGGAEFTVKEESASGVRLARHKPFTATFREAAEQRQGRPPTEKRSAKYSLGRRSQPSPSMMAWTSPPFCERC
jgi:hypothetical protein